MENTQNITAGSILVNTATNKLYGVCVNFIPPNKVIVFRLDNNTHPIFSKFNINPNIIKAGVINEHQYAPLKSALLKHYRTYNLTPSELKMLTPLMTFAFPLGIPEYQPNVELPERDLKLMDLHSKLNIGTKLFLNTTDKSTYSHLNNKTVKIIEKTPEGIWVNLPTNAIDPEHIGNTLYFLFFKNAEIPTFSGISRVLPIDEADENINQMLLDTFKNLKDSDSLTTTMQFNGDKMRVSPNTKRVIFPEVYQNMIYSPATDNFIVEPDTLNTTLANKLGNNLHIANLDNATGQATLNIDNEIVYDNKPDLTATQPKYTAILTPDGEFQYEAIAQDGGGDGDDKVTQESLLERTLEESKPWSVENLENKHNIDDIDAGEGEISTQLAELVDDDEYKDFIKSFKRKMPTANDAAATIPTLEDDDSKEATNDSNETDGYNSEEYEIADEDEIEDLGTFQKVRRVEVDELEKVYKESIQKGDLYKYKINKIPRLRRNDPTVINNLNKQINIISLFKNYLTGDERNLKFIPQNFKPLVTRYLKGDFTNRLLIPLVINRKKIYLDKAKKLQKDEFDPQTHQVIENFYDDLGNLIHMQDKKNVQVQNDVYTGNIISEMAPITSIDDTNMGLFFRLGEKFDSQDTARYQQDVLTIKYCDKPIKCQSFALNTMNFDYQVNLGPMARFLDKHEDLNTAVEIDAEAEEERFDRDILYNDPHYKMYYQGDLVNVIGYVRPPLHYFNNYGSDGLLLNELWNIKHSDKSIITVNLEDINPEVLDEEISEKIDLTINPEQFVMFLLPQNEEFSLNTDVLEQHIVKMIPDIDDICGLYFTNGKNPAKTLSIDYIYKVLDKFNYDTTLLPLLVQNKIAEKNAQLLEEFEKNIEKLQDKYEKHIEKLDKKRKDERKGENKSRYHDEHNPEDFTYIDDAVFEDISKFYFESYENQSISNDSDDIRLKWFLKSVDNGRYFYKTMFSNYLKMYIDSHKLDALEGELSMIREKHNIAKLDLEAKQNVPNVGNGATNASNFCHERIKGPNIIKYPNLARLEQDNGKVAMDADGTVILPGDYAIVEIIPPSGKGRTRELYKREIIADNDMWIKENIEILHKLIADKRAQCTNTTMDISDTNKICTFNTDNIKCEPIDIFAPTKELQNMEQKIAELQSQIDYIKNIPKLVANLDKELQNDRTYLLNKLNATKRHWKQLEEDEQKLAEKIEKTIQRKKPCVHFKVTDYFFSIRDYSLDRYKMAQSVLKRFENFDDEFFANPDIIDFLNNDKNYTYCNVCNQQLICNHFKYGVKLMEENHDDINYDQIKDKYGLEHDGTYSCRVCGEFIINTEVLDIEQFAKGEEGMMIRTRELTEATPLAEQRKAYIDDFIKDILTGANTDEIQSTEDLDMKIKIFKLLKTLSGLDLLSISDEIDILNFIKSFNFVSREDILRQIARQQNISALPPAVINKAVNKEYRIYATCDIAARFLITLQTAKTDYPVTNKDCKINILGYPLINNIELRGGIDFILCLLSQMTILAEYNYLINLDSNKFISRLRKQVDEESFVRSKIYDAINNKSDTIDHMTEFNTYYTNEWNYYLPRMRPIDITWTPEKILNDANISEVTFKNLNRMIEVGYENNIHTCLNLIKGVNRIVDLSDRINPMGEGLANSCCAESYGKDGEPYIYTQYFTNRSGTIKDHYKSFTTTTILINKLKAIKRQPVVNLVYEPIYKPSQRVYHFNLDATPEETRELYLKYIDHGINKGKLHIYDRYGRCILSNEKKTEIAEKTYNHQDFKRLEAAIVTGNNIDIRSYIQEEIDEICEKTELAERKTITMLMEKMPKLDILRYLEDHLTHINAALPQIFNKKQEKSQTLIKKGETAFDIHRHLAALNKQIDIEIQHLIPRLTASDKTAVKFEKYLVGIGSFTNLYEEFKENHNERESLNFRYNKKESMIQSNLKYLNDIVNQIKNGQLTVQHNKENVRPQYREFIKFGENIGLFKMLSSGIKDIYNFAKLIKSNSNYKVLYPEFVASILHYLNVIALNSMFSVLDNKKVTKGKAEIVKYKFKSPTKTPVVDENIHMDLGDSIVMQATDDLAGAIEATEMDLVESYESKNSDNVKVITEFVIAYLDKINQTTLDYDSLTQEQIAKTIAKHDQRQIEATLRSFELLSREGYEDEYQRVVRIRMNKLKKVEYRDLTEYLKGVFGDDYLEREFDGEMVAVDEEEAATKRVEDGLDGYEQGQVGEVFDPDDYDEDIGQDYDFLEVGD